MTTRSSGFIALIKSIRRNFQFPLCEIEIKHKTHFFFPNSIWLLKEQLKVLIDIFLWSFLYPVLAGWCQVCVSVRHPSFPLLSPPAPVCVAELTTDTTDLLSHRSSGGVTEAAPLRGCTHCKTHNNGHNTNSPEWIWVKLVFIYWESEIITVLS